MSDHKSLLTRNHTRAWRTTFKSMLKPVTFEREATDSVRNPVTGVETGGTNGILETVSGMFREVDVKIQDGINITNTDSQFTVLQIDLKNTSDSSLIRPLENDRLTDSLSNKWRVIQVLNDPTDIFWHLIIRRL